MKKFILLAFFTPFFMSGLPQGVDTCATCDTSARSDEAAALLDSFYIAKKSKIDSLQAKGDSIEIEIAKIEQRRGRRIELGRIDTVKRVNKSPIVWYWYYTVKDNDRRFSHTIVKSL